MRPLIGTSTKMNLTSSELDEYLQVLRPLVADVGACDLFVLPSYPALWVARQRLAGSNIAWGAQDVHEEEAGAHTGDVSAAMLADLGCAYVEVGHAERRRDHGETDDQVGAKVVQVFRHGMAPIICVGETEEMRADRALPLILGQVRSAFGQIAPENLDGVIAYEPVWAIGAGARPASPAHVAAVHAGIHAWLRSRGCSNVRVIYGGSVDVASAHVLLAISGVDGLFIGRSALDPEHLAAIAHVAEDRVRGSLMASPAVSPSSPSSDWLVRRDR